MALHLVFNLIQTAHTASKTQIWRKSPAMIGDTKNSLEILFYMEFLVNRGFHNHHFQQLLAKHGHTLHRFIHWLYFFPSFKGPVYQSHHVCVCFHVWSFFWRYANYASQQPSHILRKISLLPSTSVLTSQHQHLAETFFLGGDLVVAGTCIDLPRSWCTRGSGWRCWRNWAWFLAEPAIELMPLKDTGTGTLGAWYHGLGVGMATLF